MYAAGFAILNRLLCALQFPESQRLVPQVAHFWTPHSGRSFMPSCAAALGFEKSQRDFLGGWSAQGSDKYARIAKLRVGNMQKAVIRAIHTYDQEDPLGEAETSLALDEHMKGLGLREEQRQKWLDLFEQRERPRDGRHTEELEQEPVKGIPEDEVPMQEAETEEFPVPEPVQKKKRGGHASVRSQVLGVDPKQNRQLIRESYEPGFYICLSGKRKIRTLHKLGMCYALPNVDYLNFEFAGQSLPAVSAYDTVCKLCARQNILDVDVSDASQTSSSTEEDR